ncbi:MAG: serine hydrolase, partial [Microbacterium sp.]|nr:serine hydrolase [Microbacterium sp.]
MMMRIRSGLAKAVSALATALAVVLVVSGCSVGGPATVALPALPTAKLPSSTVKDLTSAVTDAMAASGASGAIVGVWAPWSGSWVDG